MLHFWHSHCIRKPLAVTSSFLITIRKIRSLVMSFMYGQGEDQIDRCFYFQDTYMLPFRYHHSIYRPFMDTQIFQITRKLKFILQVWPWRLCYLFQILMALGSHNKNQKSLRQPQSRAKETIKIKASQIGAIGLLVQLYSHSGIFP